MVDHSKIVRAMIEHENNLVNYRLTWLIALQGLLFAALGFAWDKRDAWQIIIVFCAMGTFSGASCLASLYYTQRAICRLEKWWCKRCKQNPSGYDGPVVIGFPSNKTKWYMLPWFVLPVLFILGWSTIFVINFIRV